MAGSESGDRRAGSRRGHRDGGWAFPPTVRQGTTLPSAGTTSLSLMFTPGDTTDYTMAATTVSLTVNQATPTTTWATPAAITYGTALSSTQLNATESVAGMMVYSPGAGTVLSWRQPGVAHDLHTDGHDGLHNGDGHGRYHR